ncbi:MAG TPA: hypothetical protein VHE99_10320 [Gammaproteobacteria bacterium]|nr:hypothetical protein [Gammaproteobacteria bacterium]
MRKMQNKFIVAVQLLASSCMMSIALAQAPTVADVNAMQPPDICSGRYPLVLAPLYVTIQNDSDADLNIVVPRAYRSYVRSNPDRTEPIAPTVVTHNNNLGQNVSVVLPQDYSNSDEIPEMEDQQPLSERLCLQDIKRMEDQTLYAHSKYTFRIRRADFPAHLFVKFRVAAQEPYGEYEVARWEYAENAQYTQGSVRFYDLSCDVDAAKPRFTIGCTGNNDINHPIININLGHIERPLVPKPLIYGGEPGAGPPSTP